MGDDDNRDLSNWEKQTYDEWDSDSSEERIQGEKDRCKERLWSSFQNSASAVAYMYKDGSSEGRVATLWVPFKSAASAVTILYKDGQEIMDKCFELGCQMGSNRKSKDCLKWLKTKKRKIPREEVLGYICGKSPPLRTRPTAATRTPSRLSDRSGNRHLRPSDYSGGTRHDADELDTFRQAIAMQDLDGAMSSFGIRATNGAVNNDSSCNPGRRTTLGHILEELNSGGASEGRKRAAASDSYLIDSPSRKRSKLQ